MWKCLTLLLALVSVAHGKNCCYPAQFECNEGMMTGSADDEGNTALAQGLIQFSFDATGKRMYLVEQISVGNQSNTMTLLQLYNQGHQYIIRNGTCAQTPLEKWDNRGCIPDNATVGVKYQLGHQQNIWVTTYQWTVAPDTSVSFGVTDNCVPVVEFVYGTQEGTSFLSGQSFLNITLGIKDPSVFVVPDICKHRSTGSSSMVPLSVYRRRRSVLF